MHKHAAASFVIHRASLPFQTDITVTFLPYIIQSYIPCFKSLRLNNCFCINKIPTYKTADRNFTDIRESEVVLFNEYKQYVTFHRGIIHAFTTKINKFVAFLIFFNPMLQIGKNQTIPILLMIFLHIITKHISVVVRDATSAIGKANQT